MPHIIGGTQRVVDFEGLTIDELAGNVATESDRISIALVKVSNPTSEPWLTLDYDEWMCVLKGRMVLLYGDGLELEVTAGQTVFIARGERFRPVFPEGNTEYVPVCLPAFRPDRCAREDEPDSSVALRLAKLHAKRPRATPPAPADPPDVLYHMTTAARWEDAKRRGVAYFPPTFEIDGGFTHATAVPARLIETANHFYQDVAGEWVCVRFRRSTLRKHGIVVRDEEAKPVGDTPVGNDWGEWVCPHILGGLPPAVVEKEFVITRGADGRAFVAIVGVTEDDADERAPKALKGGP